MSIIICILYNIAEGKSTAYQQERNATMKNTDIRMKIKEKRLCHYEIAAKIGISECTLCRWLREELTQEKKKAIFDAINEISGGDKK